MQVFKRRRNAYPINVGLIQPINSVPQITPEMADAESSKPEQVEYSLYITGKESKIEIHHVMHTERGCVAKVGLGCIMGLSHK